MRKKSYKQVVVRAIAIFIVLIIKHWFRNEYFDKIRSSYFKELCLSLTNLRKMLAS